MIVTVTEREMFFGYVVNINLCLTFIRLYRFAVISIRLDAPFINR